MQPIVQHSGTVAAAPRAISISTDPDWSSIEIALPPTAETALTALRAARRTYTNVKQQLEDLVAYESRQATTAVNSRLNSITTAAAGTTRVATSSTAARAANKNAATAPLTASSSSLAAAAVAASAPRGVTDEMIPPSDVRPRPSHRLRHGSLFQHQHHQRSTLAESATAAADNNGIVDQDDDGSPQPRRPGGVMVNHQNPIGVETKPAAAAAAAAAVWNNNGSAATFVSLHRADTTVPLTFQKRPNLRGRRLRDILIASSSTPPVAAAAAAAAASQGNYYYSNKNSNAAGTAGPPYQGFSLAAAAEVAYHCAQRRKEAGTRQAARDALLVFGIAGTMIAAAMKLNIV